jgi:hypothetical protein
MKKKWRVAPVLLTVALGGAALRSQDAGPPAAASSDAYFADNLFPIFEKAQCRMCHNDNGVASGSRLRFPPESVTRDEVTAFGLELQRFIAKPDLEQSLLLRKPTNRIPHTGGERIRQGSDDEKVLRAWAGYLATRAETAGKASTKRVAGYPGGVRRLTHSQYNNTVRDLLGDDTHPADRFPKEDFVHGFTNQLEGQSVSPLQTEAYNRAAERLARAAFRGEGGERLIGCQPRSPADEECQNKFLRSFGQKAFRRPLTGAELQRYGKLFKAEATRTNSFTDGAQVTVEAMLQSPSFLFHLEQGPAGEFEAYRVASRLSYFLWDTMPDEDLFRAAANGDLGTPKGIETAALRLLGDDRSKLALDQFLAEWLRFDRLRSASRDRRYYPDFSAELMNSMIEETRRLFQHLVWKDKNFMEFFTAEYTFVSADLAAIYELPLPPNEFASVKYPSDSKRAGILGQGSFLTLTSKPADTSPTERGLFVREHFLCQIVPPPPPGVDTTLPPVTDEKPMTNRERLQVHLNNPACSGCHRLVDSIGFGFEHFDAIGRFREKQLVMIHPTADEMKRRSRMKPSEFRLDIDPSALVQGIPKSSFTSPRELGGILAEYPGCQRCVVKQLFRYAVGRPETVADQESIETAFGAFRDSHFSFKSLILSIVNSRPFLGG